MQVSSEEAGVLRQLLFSYIRRRLVVAAGLGTLPGKPAEKPAKMKLKREPEAADTPHVVVIPSS